MEAMGIMMPIVELHCKFIRPAHYDDLLTIRTTLKELPLGHRIEFLQEVFNDAGILLTTGRVGMYFIETNTMQKTLMPEALRDKLQPFFMAQPAE